MCTYSGDPSTSDLDALRFWTQDTEADRPLLSDEDDNFLLAEFMGTFESVVYVASIACTVIAGKYAHVTSISADGVSISGSELQDKYLKLAENLRAQYKEVAGRGAAGGDPDIMFDLDKDFSIPPTWFGTGFMDNIYAGNQNYGFYDPSEHAYAEYPNATNESSP